MDDRGAGPLRPADVRDRVVVSVDGIPHRTRRQHLDDAFEPVHMSAADAAAPPLSRLSATLQSVRVSNSAM